MGTEELLKEIKTKKKNKGLKIFLSITLIILLGVCAYLFLVKPYLNNLVTESVKKGVQYTIYSIMNEAVQCKTIPLQAENITINLIATGCLK